MSSPFSIKNVYNFDVYPSSILGTNFQNVTVLSIMDYETALSMGADAAGNHANMYPLLPEGTPDDPSATDYIRILTSSGVKTILAVSWIDLSTLELVESRTAVVTIEGVTANDVPNIIAALNQNGFNSIAVTLNPV